MNDKIIKKIKSQGHWRIKIRPSIFKKDRIISLVNCRHIIEGNAIQYAGWKFPIVNYENYNNLNNSIESYIDINMFKEYWQFFQSGQLIYFGAFYEDYQKDKILQYGGLPFLDINQKDIEKSRFTCIEYIINRITLLFDFTERLINQNALGEEFEISIELNDVKDRILFFFERSRLLFKLYKATDNQISFEKKYEYQNFIANKTEHTLECCNYIFERYNAYLSEGIIKELINNIRKN